MGSLLTILGEREPGTKARVGVGMGQRQVVTCHITKQ